MTNNDSHTASATRYLRLPEGVIAYDIQGNGPLVVLVPGMGDLRSTYRFLVPALVAAGYTVASVDLRGHGDSSATFSSYGDRETAADLTALLRELDRPAVIIGNSMAAGAAVIVAAENPKLVDGLVLVGPFVREGSTHPALMRLVVKILFAAPWTVAAWRAYLPTLYAGARPADFAAHRQAIAASLRRPGYARAFRKTTGTDHTHAHNALAAVTAPTLVLMGANDPDFPSPEREAEWIASALGGETVMIDNAGHYPHSQQPEATSTAILRFLAEGNARA